MDARLRPRRRLTTVVSAIRGLPLMFDATRPTRSKSSSSVRRDHPGWCTTARRLAPAISWKPTHHRLQHSLTPTAPTLLAAQGALSTRTSNNAESWNGMTAPHPTDPAAGSHQWPQWGMKSGSRSDSRAAVVGVRRDKAALSSGCEAHPAIRSSRKQPEQAWRRRNV